MQKVYKRMEKSCRLFGDLDTYTMWGLKKPPYSSSKAWGRSQWKIVTNGFKPTFINRKN